MAYRPPNSMRIWMAQVGIALLVVGNVIDYLVGLDKDSDAVIVPIGLGTLMILLAAVDWAVGWWRARS